MRIKTVKKEAETLEHVSDYFKALEVCIKAIEKEAESLEHVPDHFKTEEVCKRAIEADLYTLVFCPDSLVTQEQIKSWYDNDYDDDEAPGWYQGYQKCKTQKAQIKKELMSIAWHPSRWWDLRIPEDEKKETEKSWKEQRVVFCPKKNDMLSLKRY